MGLSPSKSPSEAPRTTHTSRRMQVFVQFHIPKTGGESVNSWFRLNAPTYRYLRVQSEKDFNAALGTVQQALASSTSTNSTRFYIEVHAGTDPSWQDPPGDCMLCDANRASSSPPSLCSASPSLG